MYDILPKISYNSAGVAVSCSPEHDMLFLFRSEMADALERVYLCEYIYSAESGTFTPIQDDSGKCAIIGSSMRYDVLKKAPCLVLSFSSSSKR